MSLPEAIARGWLAPFWYRGVYDPVDYTAIRWRNSHYDDEELARAQTQTNHGEAVFRAWQAHRQTRTLAFCTSVRHAEFLTQQFAGHGVKSANLHAQSGWRQRQEAISDLAAGRLEIIFSVDLFNEGVDIPSVDTMLLIRPTESSVVFIQQLGRGLRLQTGKTHCSVIDLIGNYRNADANCAG